MPADRLRLWKLRTVRTAAVAALLGISACSTPPRPDADTGKVLPIDAYVATGKASPTMLKASEMLPADWRKGDHYEVEEMVRNDGLTNTYTLNSPYGQFEVHGDDQLRYRENEVEVLAALQDYGVTQPMGFGLGGGNGAENYVEGGAQLIVYPARAIANVPLGFWNYGSQVAEMTRSRRTFYEDSYAEELIGFSQAKREFAGRTSVDPYTTNPAMQERLNALSWPSWAGGILATVGTIPVAGIAGIALTGASLPESMHLVNLDKAPEDLRIDNRRKLKKMGVKKRLREAFLSHPWYSPRHQTIIVGSLSMLTEANGRPVFIATAMAAGNEEQAFTMQRTAELLRAFHEYASPITGISAPQGLIVARAADGAVVVPVVADWGVWTPGTQDLVAACDRAAASEPAVTRKVLWVSGRLSPAMADAVRQRGWLVEEQIFNRHLLAYEYQEQMATKEALMGERIFPRIGD